MNTATRHTVSQERDVNATTSSGRISIAGDLDVIAITLNVWALLQTD
jgi:hypothetical protein